MDDLDGFSFVHRFRIVELAHAHATEADCRDTQSVTPETAIFHRAFQQRAVAEKTPVRQLTRTNKSPASSEVFEKISASRSSGIGRDPTLTKDFADIATPLCWPSLSAAHSRSGISHNRGSTGSLSTASTARAHSWTCEAARMKPICVGKAP